jgi:hypothetical protein
MKNIRVPYFFVTSSRLYRTYIINGLVTNTEEGHSGSNVTDFPSKASPFYSREENEYLGCGFCGFSQVKWANAI